MHSASKATITVNSILHALKYDILDLFSFKPHRSTHHKREYVNHNDVSGQ